MTGLFIPQTRGNGGGSAPASASVRLFEPAEATLVTTTGAMPDTWTDLEDDVTGLLEVDLTGYDVGPLEVDFHCTYTGDPFQSFNATALEFRVVAVPSGNVLAYAGHVFAPGRLVTVACHRVLQGETPTSIKVQWRVPTGNGDASPLISTLVIDWPGEARLTVKELLSVDLP